MSDGQDFFADMAAGMDDAPRRPEMEAVPAPVLPPRELSTQGKPGLAPPPAHEKLDSHEKMNRRVAELREHYEPFLRDLTPSDPDARPTRWLERFDFRFEEDADKADVQRPYTDAGDWETVDIPHYRGPVGPWAAYYRTTFTADDALRSRGRVWLRFKAVDYKCQVFVNGRYVGGHEGLFAPFGFDITDVLRDGEAEQTLLVRVENDAKQQGSFGNRPWEGYGAAIPEYYQLDGDKVYAGTGQGWDSPLDPDGTPGRGGWTHCPPGAGIWQPVYLEARPTTGIDDLWVRPFPDRDAAELWLETWRSDFSRTPTAVELTAYPNNFEGEPVSIGRRELAMAGPKRSVYRLAFHLPGFRWWTIDEPNLYTLRVRLICEEVCEENSGEAIDTQDVTFGMRSFTQDEQAGPENTRAGTFYLNGQPIVLRGTNEMGNLSVPIQEGNPEQTIEDLLIGKAAHLNYWRITQRPVQREVYDLCDRLGVLFQTDLPMFGTLRQSCVEETARQAGEMERLVRRHPAAVVSSFINEPTPERNTIAKRHRVVDRATMEDFFEVCIRYTRLYNPDRVIKCADGDYDPPPRHGMLDEHAYVCMHEDHGVEVGKLHKGELFPIKAGWRCGVGEYGAEAIEPLHTMRKLYPAAWLPEDDDDTTWTPDRIPFCQAWGWHHQWYDEQDTIKDWIAASHHHQDWAVRFMQEGFRRRADIINSTTIHLLINSRPNNWLKSLVSVDREPMAGYFALADANTPLAVNLRTDRHALTGGDNLEAELWVLNDTTASPEGLSAVYWITRGDEVLMIDRCDAEAKPVGAAYQGTLHWATPSVEAPTPITMHAALLDAQGHVLHDHRVNLTLWPGVDRSLLAGRRVAILGREGDRAWRLAEAFGGSPRPWHESEPPDLVLADSADAARGAAASLDAYLHDGGAFYGLWQPPGSAWPIGGHGVHVEPGRGHQFVSRKTGHPIVEGLDPFHFSFWYDHERGRIAHLNQGHLAGDGLRPITLTGKGTWYSPRAMLPATAERAVGRGRAIFDQVTAAERMPGEPRAAAYLSRVLNDVL